jgi:Fe-Mn family superoxide dismutase
MKKGFSVIIMLVMHLGLMAQFSLAPLPFSYKALEPVIDATTVEVHYHKHHQGYVTNLNAALSEITRTKTLEELLSQAGQYGNAIRNNAGGHYNHTLYWQILTPESNTQIDPTLLTNINNTFGSLGGLYEQLVREGLSRFGSGWTWLVITPDGKLKVGSTPNQDNPLMDVSELKGYPLLGIDVWEHAYYLNYKHKRADYLQAICTALNWTVISNRYRDVTSLRNNK